MIGFSIKGNSSFSIYVASPFLYDRTDEEAAYNRGQLFGGRQMDLSQYQSLPCSPISINIQPNIMFNAKNPQALQNIANAANAAFRVNGVTYRPH